MKDPRTERPRTRASLGSRLRHPQTTVRWRLTLLYGGMFLVCGAVLLAVTYVLVSHQITGGEGIVVPPSPARASGGTNTPFTRRSGWRRRSTLPPPNLTIPPNVPAAVVRVLRSSAGQEFLRLVETATAGQRAAPARDRVRDRARDHGDPLGAARMARRRPGAAPSAYDHRHRARDLGDQPPPPARPPRPARRAQDAGGHDRCAARASGGGIRVSATVCRQRFARAAHPIDHDAHRIGRGQRQAATCRRRR